MIRPGVNSFPRGAIGAISAHNAPRKAVDLGHIILVNVLSKLHSNVFQSVNIKDKANNNLSRESVKGFKT